MSVLYSKNTHCRNGPKIVTKNIIKILEAIIFNTVPKNLPNLPFEKLKYLIRRNVLKNLIMETQEDTAIYVTLHTRS